MAKTPLRTYLKEIEMMIERGQVDEAAAHCRHILEAYPKLVGAYRLMGKSFLEGKRYTDAADLFQRVLSTVPDDFVSHVGMSIIREDEGNLDAAIWHMERAFEVQPYNAAIQGELKRLYGRRDGVEPPKVRLTRGALARMYARGNLYQQAITELRAGLAEDQSRPDLQVLLARMFYLSGAKVEAVETCSQLLNHLPYCLEANRILAAILPETGRKEDAQAYAQRVQSLDPYLAQASPAAPSGDGVPEASVILERMEYTRGVTGSAPSQPAWAASLGVSVAPFTNKEEVLPDWLEELEKSESEPVQEEGLEGEQPVEAAEAPILPEPRAPETPDWLAAMAAEEEEKPTEEEAIPDWMKEAGWTSAPGAADQPPQELSDLEAEGVAAGEGEIAAAEIPDWLKALAPEGLEQASTPEEEAAATEALMPWLKDIGLEPTPQAPQEAVEETVSEVEIPEASESPSQAGATASGTLEEVPDWLKGIEATEVESTVSEGEAGVVAEEAIQIPDWLKEAAPGEPQEEEVPAAAELEEAEVEQPAYEPEEAAPAEQMPEWMAQMQPDAAEQPVEGVVPEVEIPDWLKEIETTHEPVEAEIGTPQEAAVPEEASLSNEDAAIAWLESLAAKQGVPEEELTTKPEERPEAPPEWISEAEAEIPNKAAEAETTAEEFVPGELPEWAIERPVEEAELSEEVVAEEEAPALPLEAPEWLPEEGTVMEETETFVAAEAADEAEALPGELPDWLKALQEETEAEEAVGTEAITPTPVKSEEVEAEPAEAEATQPYEGGEEAALAWLEGLAAKQGAPEEELITTPEERLETPPEWVSETAGVETAPAEAAPVEEQPEEVAVPEWLEGMSVEAMAQEGEAAPEEIEAETPIPPEVEAPMEGIPSQAASEEAALAWLEGLAAKQGASEEELITKPEERPVETPDWIQELAAEPGEAVPEAVAAEAVTEEVPAPEEVPQKVEGIETIVPVLEETQPEVIPAEAAVEEPLPDWLETLASEEEVISAEVVEPETAPQEEIELPEWMKEPEEKEELPWQPGPIEAPAVPVPALDINQASLVELEALPGVGFRMAQSILNYRQDHGPFSSLEDLLQVPNFDRDLLQELGEQITVAKAEPLSPLVVEEELRAIDADQEILIRARNALMQEQIETMTEYYSRLIKQERLLDEVIHDLHEALYRFPVEVGIWETLGDAYARCDQLQEALDAYTKAEELLR